MVCLVTHYAVRSQFTLPTHGSGSWFTFTAAHTLPVGSFLPFCCGCCCAPAHARLGCRIRLPRALPDFAAFGAVLLRFPVLQFRSYVLALPGSCVHVLDRYTHWLRAVLRLRTITVPRAVAVRRLFCYATVTRTPLRFRAVLAVTAVPTTCGYTLVLVHAAHRLITGLSSLRCIRCAAMPAVPARSSAPRFCHITVAAHRSACLRLPAHVRLPPHSSVTAFWLPVTDLPTPGSATIPYTYGCLPLRLRCRAALHTARCRLHYARAHVRGCGSRVLRLRSAGYALPHLRFTHAFARLRTTRLILPVAHTGYALWLLVWFTTCCPVTAFTLPAVYTLRFIYPRLFCNTRFAITGLNTHTLWFTTYPFAYVGSAVTDTRLRGCGWLVYVVHGYVFTHALRCLPGCYATVRTRTRLRLVRFTRLHTFRLLPRLHAVTLVLVGWVVAYTVRSAVQRLRVYTPRFRFGSAVTAAAVTRWLHTLPHWMPFGSVPGSLRVHTAHFTCGCYTPAVTYTAVRGWLRLGWLRFTFTLVIYRFTPLPAQLHYTVATLYTRGYVWLPRVYAVTVTVYGYICGCYACLACCGSGSRLRAALFPAALPVVATRLGSGYTRIHAHGYTFTHAATHWRVTHGCRTVWLVRVTMLHGLPVGYTRSYHARSRLPRTFGCLHWLRYTVIQFTRCTRTACRLRYRALPVRLVTHTPCGCRYYWFSSYHTVYGSRCRITTTTVGFTFPFTHVLVMQLHRSFLLPTTAVTGSHTVTVTLYRLFYAFFTRLPHVWFAFGLRYLRLRLPVYRTRSSATHTRLPVAAVAVLRSGSVLWIHTYYGSLVHTRFCRYVTHWLVLCALLLVLRYFAFAGSLHTLVHTTVLRFFTTTPFTRSAFGYALPYALRTRTFYALPSPRLY